MINRLGLLLASDDAGVGLAVVLSFKLLETDGGLAACYLVPGHFNTGDAVSSHVVLIKMFLNLKKAVTYSQRFNHLLVRNQSITVDVE